MSHLARIRPVLFLALLALGAVPASAAISQYQILLNTDVNPNSGCDVSTVDGTFGGVEHILLTTVETTGPASANVTRIERQVCVTPATDTFGPLILVDDTDRPVGIGNGTDGFNVVETYFPGSVLAGNKPPVIRLGVTSSNGGGAQDAMLTARPNTGQPIQLVLAAILDVPTVSEWGLILLGLLLAAAAMTMLRRRSAAALLLVLALLGAAGAAWAIVSDLNGQTTAEWTPADLLAEDTAGDAPVSVDLRALFGAFDQTNNRLVFRLDVSLEFVTAPIAVDDPYSTPSNTPLVVAAPGVLGNDTVNGATITAFTTPTANGGTVVLNADGSFTYTPALNFTGTDTFTYTLTNSAGADTATVTITIANGAPVANPDAATLTEDDPATAINVLANDTDPEGDPFTIASVTQPANGTVVITGGGTGLTYQPNPNYCNTPPGTTLDTFTYTLTPGGAVGTVTVTVTCLDDNPAAVNDAATVAEDAAATAVDVLANDTDVDAGPISITSVTQPANGTVVITGGGTGLTYQPNAGYCNTPPGTTLDTFTYTLTPGGSVATVTMTVTCDDDAPTAVNDAATVAEDAGATAVDVLANDTDTDGGPISVASVTQPANGTVVITGGGTGLTYQPNPNYCNTPPGTTLDTFTYTLTPGSSSATVTMTVTCTDDNPTAVNDAATVAEDSGATAVNVLANDTDPDAGPISITSVTQPANGAVVITGGGTGLTYQPNANYCNTPPGTTLDTFTYTLTPGGSSATVTMTVTCDDDNPTAVADAATVAEDSGANAVNVLANDTDPDGGPISITSVTQPANGAVVITGGGTGLTYQPNPNYCNTPPGTTLDTFTYTLTPGGSSTTVTMSVTCVDDDPVAVNDAATVNEDSGANAINVLANDTDIDGGPISITSVTQPANGTVVITGGGTGLTYQPNANFCTTGTPETFTYTLTPGGSVATVSVTVTCVDDNPVAVADAATVSEDSGANAVNVLANDTDIDGGPISITSVTQPANGAVVITGGGTGLTYQPNPNYCNTPPGTTLDTFTYTLTPGGSSTTVTMSVTCVDDNPVAVADAATVTEDSGANAINVLANDTDVDAGPISVTSVTQPANGAVVITGGGTGLSYQPNPNYCNAPPGTTLDTFTYTLTPGGSSTTVTVTVTCVDDPPVAVADAATVNEDSGANAIPVLANDTDPDGGPISINSVTQPTNGAVVITGGGTGLTYAPNPNYCNTPPGTTLDTFTYTLAPGGSFTTVTMSVICINDPPVADNDTFDFIGNTELRVDLGSVTTPHTPEATPSTFGVLDGDSDPVENDPIFVAGIVGCADVTAPFDCTIAGFGTVSVTANGRFSFVPEPGDAGGSEVFQYTLSDGQATVNATVTLTRFERVWYVENDATAGGLGRSHDPFDTLAEAQTASSPNDYIFVYFGDGTTGDQSSGIALKNGQHLIGEYAGLSIPVNLNANGSPTVLLAQPGATACGGGPCRPLLDDTVADATEGVSAIDAVPAEIVGLNLAGNVNAINWTTNAAFAGTGTLSIRDNIVRSATAEGVDINLAGTGATVLAFHDNNLTSTGTALDLQETGTGALTITRFDDNVVSGNTGGSGLIVNNAIFDATPGGAINTVDGGTTNIGVLGNGVGGAGMALTNVQGDLHFTGNLNIFADAGAGLVTTGTGAGFQFRVNTGGAATGTIQAGGGPAVDSTATALDLRLTTLQSTNSASTGVSLTNVTGTFSAESGSSITNATGTDFNISGGTATVTYQGTITDDVGQLVNVSGATGGTKSFQGAITDGDDGDGSGVSLTGNGGATVRFSGGLILNTGANAAFTATGGGTVEVCDENPCNPASTGALHNKLTTTTGTALNVANTIIGANELEFRSISAGTAASGPTNGILINNTNSLGGLTVTGTGAAGSGGTIQRATGAGISLTSTVSVNLSSMNVQNGSDDGINATTVNGFLLSNFNVTTNGDSTTDEGIELQNVTGSASISGTNVTGNAHNNLFLDNTTGTLTSLAITGSTFNNNSAANGNHGLLFQARNTAAVNAVNITGSTFSGNKSIGMQILAADTAVVSDFTVSGSTFTNQQIAVDFSQSQTANLNFELSNNATITGHNSHAINVFTAAGAGTGGTVQGRIQNNTIGNAGIVNSGSAIGNCMRININGGADATVLIDNNMLRQCPNGRGIEVIGRNGTGGLDVTVTNNNVNPQDTSGFPLSAILVQSNCVTTCNTVRSDVRGNTVPAGAVTDLLSTHIALVETGASVLQLVDSAPASADCTAQLTSTNTGSASASPGCALIAGPISTPPL